MMPLAGVAGLLLGGVQGFLLVPLWWLGALWAVAWPARGKWETSPGAEGLSRWLLRGTLAAISFAIGRTLPAPEWHAGVLLGFALFFVWDQPRAALRAWFTGRFAAHGRHLDASPWHLCRVCRRVTRDVLQGAASGAHRDAFVTLQNVLLPLCEEDGYQGAPAEEIETALLTLAAERLAMRTAFTGELSPPICMCCEEVIDEERQQRAVLTLHLSHPLLGAPEVQVTASWLACPVCGTLQARSLADTRERVLPALQAAIGSMLRGEAEAPEQGREAN